MKIGIIIVCYDNAVNSAKLIGQLIDEIDSKDKLVVIDNNPNHKNWGKLKSLSRIDYLIKNKNVGFGAACNQGADLIKNDVDAYLFLNPDTLIEKGTIEKYKQVTKDYSAYMANLLTKKNSINNDGSIVHISGLSWSGNYLNKFFKNTNNKYRSIYYASGACLFIWKKEFYDIGKFYAEYFLYYEDTDLSSRLILNNKKIGLINDAVVYHDYDSKISDVKYLNIQKNRYLYILINWPIKILILLLPSILLVELLLITHSFINNKFKLKIRSYYEVFKTIPKIYILRKKTMKLMKINSIEYLKMLSPKIDTCLIPHFPGINIFNQFFVIYYKTVKKLLD